ncbi:DUF2325 domain-containing protein [Thiohalocapsa marina]|uniref:DUF2325 domain-containing protein n=2 Tax=Thiohalocapsa marina TaxID=424902 RepID=A0A5M8FLJ2_9GAMM|nr:DUF2325 domain-containing protein [Thiohalocapsa marina]
MTPATTSAIASATAMTMPPPKASFAAPAAPEPSTRASSARLKLWDIPARFHCPIIGTCLHVGELRELARKIGCPRHAGLSDYEIHVSYVTSAESKNQLSVAAQKLLERKHAKELRRFATLKTPAELQRVWDEQLAEGQVPGAFWALMTHPRADNMTRDRAYEAVHMLSHQVGAGLNADTKRLTEARKALQTLRQDCAADAARSLRKLAAREARIEQLQQQLEEANGAVEALQQAQLRILELESGDQLRELRAQINAMQSEALEQARRRKTAEAQADALRQQLDRAQTRIHALSEQLSERSASCAALEQVVNHLDLGSDTCCGKDCSQCPRREERRLDLGGRRILCVGGRGSLATRYRELVKRCNGELVRHDGGLEQSSQRLEALLASADAVVCPADNVSHDAYLRAKRFCKRTDKPCLLLERSGIDTFVRALADLAEHPQGAMSGVQTV